MICLTFSSFTKCFDDDCLEDPTLRRRGHAGVSILYRNRLQPYVKEISDGGKQNCFVSQSTLKKPILLICTYLPTRGNGYSRDDYLAVLDEISEIKQKYGDTHNILLGGDMNASIHREKNCARDTDFQNFLAENELAIPRLCTRQPTFYHFNGKDSSQIDYFIESANIVTSYRVLKRELSNVSTHDPVSCHSSLRQNREVSK